MVKLLKQWRPAVQALVAMERGDVGINTSAAQQEVTVEQVARAKTVLETLFARSSPNLQADLEPVLSRLDEFAGRTPIEIWEMMETEDAKRQIDLP
jgi:hypothetical protein